LVEWLVGELATTEVHPEHYEDEDRKRLKAIDQKISGSEDSAHRGRGATPTIDVSRAWRVFRTLRTLVVDGFKRHLLDGGDEKGLEHPPSEAGQDRLNARQSLMSLGPHVTLPDDAPPFV
jgi:hypothetical protein